MKIRGINKILTYHYAIITLLPFLMIMLLSIALIFPREKADAENKHSQIEKVIDAKIESFLQEQVSDLTQITFHHNIKSVLQQELDRLVNASHALNVISYVSKDGIIKKVGLSFEHQDALHADLEGMDLSGTDVFKKVSALNKPVWSEAFLSVISGGPAIAYALPVDGAYLIGEISLIELEFYLNRITENDNSLLYIIDHKGQIIVEKLSQLDSVNINLSNLELFQKITRNNHESKNRFTGTLTLEGKEYLGTLSSMKTLDWHSLLATPRNEVFRNANNTIKIILSGLLASLLLAAFSSRLLVKKFSGQFERLAVHTREVAQSGFKTDKQSESILEFQQITESLALMAATIKNREESLLNALDYLKVNSLVFENLYELSKMEKSSEQEILDCTLNAALMITGSPIGYIFLLDDSEDVLTLRACTNDVMTISNDPSSPTIFQLAETGLMGEAVRQRKSIIINNYAENSSSGGGLPQGHLKISRIMNQPVIYYGKIVMLVGLGNRLTDYEKTDAKNLELIMDAAWLLIQRVRAELLLKESEGRSLQMFMQNDDALIFFKLPPLKPLDANPAALNIFKAAGNDIRSLSIRRIFNRTGIHTLLTEIKNGKHEIYIEKIECRRINGDRFFASLKANIITIKNESVLFCSFRDISARLILDADVKATNARMIQANKMASLGLLVSSVAHEINNPNQCIGMNAFLLKRIWKDSVSLLEKHHNGDHDLHLDGTPFDEVKQLAPQLFDTMVDSSKRIDGYIQQLMDFVRIGKSGEYTHVNVNHVIENAVSILWYQIRNSTEKFSTLLSTESLLVYANAQQLEQVIINMITNALQALVSKSAAIRVETCRSVDGSNVLIRFIDEGKGMDKATLARLEEPFFSTRQNEGGTGLGVYIAANIIKEHKGMIEYDSRPGLGTKVTITLPAAFLNSDNDTAPNTKGLPS